MPIIVNWLQFVNTLATEPSLKTATTLFTARRHDDVPFAAMLMVYLLDRPLTPVKLNVDEQEELRQMSLSRSLPVGDFIRARDPDGKGDVVAQVKFISKLFGIAVTSTQRTSIS